METFFTLISSFPTVLWTGLLLFCLMYWGVALIGLADFDTPEIDPEIAMAGLGALRALQHPWALMEFPFRWRSPRSACLVGPSAISPIY